MARGYKAVIEVLDTPKTITWAGGNTDALVARRRSYASGQVVGLLVRAFQEDGTTEEKTYVPGIGAALEVGPTSELRLAPR